MPTDERRPLEELARYIDTYAEGDADERRAFILKELQDLVRETERRVREECAQIADQQDPIETSEYDQGHNAGMSAAARAIRARAEEKV